jgi:group I intron endonuclease
MYGKTHTKQTKGLMRANKRKYPSGVGIYDLNNNLVKSFEYATDLAKYLNVSKVTISKYLNKGLLFKNIYYFKINKSK